MAITGVCSFRPVRRCSRYSTESGRRSMLAKMKSNRRGLSRLTCEIARGPEGRCRVISASRAGSHPNELWETVKENAETSSPAMSIPKWVESAKEPAYAARPGEWCVYDIRWEPGKNCQVGKADDLYQRFLARWRARLKGGFAASDSIWWYYDLLRENPDTILTWDAYAYTSAEEAVEAEGELRETTGRGMASDQRRLMLSDPVHPRHRASPACSCRWPTSRHKRRHEPVTHAPSEIGSRPDAVLLPVLLRVLIPVSNIPLFPSLIGSPTPAGASHRTCPQLGTLVNGFLIAVRRTYASSITGQSRCFGWWRSSPAGTRYVTPSNRNGTSRFAASPKTRIALVPSPRLPATVPGFLSMAQHIAASLLGADA